MSALRVLLMTAPSAESAEAITRTLVEEHLIACGNITMPIASIYRWQGEIERASEVLVIMKTTEDAAADVIRRVSELHPYELPEVLSLPVDSGHARYIDWVQASVAINHEV
ncbi:MAG TPA: divalent-cation tolerance protein CutA [Longimicrobiales bacterium]